MTLVLAGGPILTVAEPERAEAVAVRGDRILHVGTLAESRGAAGADREERDLGGRALVPGFVDAHIHPLMYGQTSSWLDASPDRAPSIEALVALLAEGARRLPADAAIWAYGFDARRLAERRPPTAADLDRAAPGRRTYVMHSSGHGAVLSSAALAAARIGPGTTDVAGGHIGRDETGAPNGLLMDAAWERVFGDEGVKVGRHGPNIHVPEPDATLDGHLASAQRAILAAGITSVCDAQVTRRELQAYLRARDAEQLHLRVDLLVLSSLLDELLELGLVATLGDDRLRFTGVKLYADGSLIGRTAYFEHGYPGDPHTHGILYHDPDDYRRLVMRAHLAGLQTATHALSPDAIGLVLEAIAAAQQAGPRPDVRHRIEHCGLPSDAQVDRMARLGVVPVAQSQHMRSYGDGALAAAGPELGARYHPLGLFAAAGIPFALSSDAPVAPPAPLVAIQAAVERRTVLGTVLGGEELRVSAARALRACTLDAARASHHEASIGSIEAGKLADFAVLSADPTRTEPGQIGHISVEETWIGGRRLV